MDERVDLTEMADVGGLFEGVLSYSADVDVLDGGVGEFLGVVEVGELVEPIVGNFGDSDVGFARVGIGAFGEADFGEDSEERGLADLGKTDDAGFHGDSSQLSVISFQVNQKNKSLGAIRIRGVRPQLINPQKGTGFTKEKVSLLLD